MLDLGCGSGRWAKHIAPNVGQLHLIDPSSAIDVAKINLHSYKNCIFHKTSVDSINLDNESMDFGYSLGVLHHVPDTNDAIQSCVNKLKKGAPFLLYLYYNFENKPEWYRIIWNFSEIVRKFISKTPHNIRYFLSQLIAVFIYLPFSKFALFLEKFGFNVNNLPLSAYRKYSFYTIRTDSLDRFGTQLEQRFSKLEIKKMMENSGLENIKFNEDEPFWCAIGYKK